MRRNSSPFRKSICGGLQDNQQKNQHCTSVHVWHSIPHWKPDIQSLTMKVVLNGLQKIVFAPSLQYMETERFVAKLTSTRSASSLHSLHSRKGDKQCQKKSEVRPSAVLRIREMSQMVRSDPTNPQQYGLSKRVISVWKLKRNLNHWWRKTYVEKTKVYRVSRAIPTILLYAFRDHDNKEDGGGAKAHPRLTTEALYWESWSMVAVHIGPRKKKKWCPH